MKMGNKLQPIKQEASKILLISDVHYGIKSGSENNINYVKWMDMMDDYFDNFFIPYVNTLKEEGETPAVVICGDFFDNRISIRVDVMNRAVDMMKRLCDACPIYLLAGNHDCYHSEDAEINSFQVFSGLPLKEITVDTKIEFINSGKKVEVDAFPWTSDKKALSDKISKSSADYVIIHADVNGMRYSSNVQITNGVYANGFTGQRVFSGHIHKRQELNKVTYVGCPYQLDRSDVGNSKGIYVITNKEEGVTEDFIENTYSPKFVVYTYDEFVNIARLMPDDLRNNYIEVTYEKNHKADATALMNRADEFGCASLVFTYIEEEVEVAELTDEQKSMTIKDTMEEYINSMSVDDETKAFLLEKNREYLDKINNRK